MTRFAGLAYGHQISLLLINKYSWSWQKNSVKLRGCSNGSLMSAVVNSFISVKCKMVTVHCTPLSFVLVVIHLVAAPSLQLLFLKAIVAFTGSTDRMS